MRGPRGFLRLTLSPASARHPHVRRCETISFPIASLLDFRGLYGEVSKKGSFFYGDISLVLVVHQGVFLMGLYGFFSSSLPHLCRKPGLPAESYPEFDVIRETSPTGLHLRLDKPSEPEPS